MGTSEGDGTVRQVEQTAPRRTPTLSAGEVIGDYRITEVAGSGGMGIVYRAWDLRLERPVAVKILTFGSVEPFRSRLLREAQLAAALDHPNVVPIYAWGEEGERVFIVMRLVEGTDLRKLVDTTGPLAPSRAVRLLRQAASALDAAHAPEKGMLHRDVKPQNLLLAEPNTPGEQVYLADFGLANSPRVSNGELTYQAGAGTPSYMSPEQFGDTELDPRSDLYALAAVAMFLLTGEPPFTGATPWEVAVGHLQKAPPAASARMPGLRPAVDAVLAAGLAKEPTGRPASCREFVEALERALTDTGHAQAARLPVPLTSFVGREDEVARLRALLAETRLVTVTGPGGVGKSRLALAAVDGWSGAADPVLIELATATDGASVAVAVVGALRIPRAPTEPAEDAMVNALENQRRLLVLDNCEHLLDPLASLLSRLLGACPGVTVLATSRVPLGMAGETVVPIWPLEVPTAGLGAAGLAECESVQLFVTRAAASGVTVSLQGAEGAAVAAICRQLDGIPLAIELAARRARALSPAQIAARLDDVLGFLTGGRDAPDRQRTLAATMRWTYDLLPGDEQAGFRFLAAFCGGFDLDAAEEVLAAAPGVAHDGFDVLTGLVDWSLVQRDPDVPGRYRLLETARAFGTALLDSEPAQAALARNAHLRWVTALLQAAVNAAPADRPARLARVDAAIDNVRAALRFAAGAAAPAGALLALASWFGQTTHRRAHSGEAARWLDEALERGGADSDRLRALAAAAGLASMHGDRAKVTRLATTALAEWEAAGGGEGVPMAHLALGLVCAESGDLETATEHWLAARAAAVALGLKGYQARALHNLAAVALDAGDAEGGAALTREGMVLAAACGEIAIEAYGRLNLGAIDLERGDLDSAHAWFTQAEQAGEVSGDMRLQSAARHYLGVVALDHGDLVAARALLREVLRIARLIRQRTVQYEALDTYAESHALAGDHAAAARLHGLVVRARAETGHSPLRDMRERHEARMKVCRDALGDAEFEAAAAAGAQQNVETVVAALLDE
ncbi:MAG: protein kinase domain-containing protein [Sporichthyaceae bacterium]